MPQNIAREPVGHIARTLEARGVISRDQLDYALRVQDKLSEPRPLLHVLKELKYVTDREIRETLRQEQVSMRLGDLLLELGVTSGAALNTAVRIQQEEVEQGGEKRRIGEILITNHLIDQKKLISTLSLQLGFPHEDPQLARVDKALFQKLSTSWCMDKALIPLREEDGRVLVAFADPLDREVIADTEEMLNRPIRPAIAGREAILEAIRQVGHEIQVGSAGHSDEKSIVGIANTILITAIQEDASDVHVEPMRDRLRVRFRLDGVMIHYRDYPREIALPLISRIKVMCGADIAEKRRHQDGRLLFSHSGVRMDMRVSFYITVFGEKVVLRLLKKQGQLLDIGEIGMTPSMVTRLRNEALGSPSGVVMVTGPTGSGKSSTVYSCIHHLNSPQVAIITAEDPVEYMLDGIAQCSINPGIGLTFEETLRHIVRQDPDIVVIGEVRDHFSARTCIETALTGHKVLTTFHTEDTVGALIRLLNMDIEPFLVASTLVCVVSQRLLSRICPYCSTPTRPSNTELRLLGITGNELKGGDFHRGEGCPHCRHTGYSGRIGVFEMLMMNDSVRDAVLERRTSHALRRTCFKAHEFMTLLEDGLLKASRGVTTVSEVLRCLPRLQPPRSLSTLRRIAGE